MLSCIHLFSIFILQSHHSTLKIAADLDYLSWIALLRDWGLVFSDKSAQRCRLNKATQVTANMSCHQADESLLTASSHVFAEVPNRPGLFHRQGAADHRADVREGPGGGDCGKTSQAVSPTCRLFSLAPSYGGKHRLFRLAALLQRSCQNTTSGTDRGISWQMSFIFIHLLPAPPKCILYLSRPRLRILNHVKGWMDLALPSVCSLRFHWLRNLCGPM